jgi:cyclopropane-fatty-acyl-phospholipid synthase
VFDTCRRLEKNFSDSVADDLQQRFPNLRTEKDMLAFKRKWMYMFAYAEVGYARAYTTCNCWTFVRPVSGRMLIMFCERDSG